MSKVPAHFGLHRTDSPVGGEAHFPLQKNALPLRIWDDLKNGDFFLNDVDLLVARCPVSLFGGRIAEFVKVCETNMCGAGRSGCCKTEKVGDN